MKSHVQKILLILFSLLLPYCAMAIEEPQFTLLEKNSDFELREYPAMILAEVDVPGDLNEASNAGFRLIASYIFGANTTRTNQTAEKISMTAPVIVAPASSKIAMTAPVSVEKNDALWRVNFVMPAAYTLSTLPIPNDPRVKLRETAPQKMAVLVFSGLTGARKVEEKTSELLAWMSNRNLQAISPPKLARYNAPWTLPFLRRNEILIAYQTQENNDRTPK